MPECRKRLKRKGEGYSVLHGICSDDVGVVITNISGDAIGEEADADVPLHHEMAALLGPPNPSHPHPILPVPLLEMEAVQLLASHCKRSDPIRRGRRYDDRGSPRVKKGKCWSCDEGTSRTRAFCIYGRGREKILPLPQRQSTLQWSKPWRMNEKVRTPGPPKPWDILCRSYGLILWNATCTRVHLFRLHVWVSL